MIKWKVQGVAAVTIYSILNHNIGKRLWTSGKGPIKQSRLGWINLHQGKHKEKCGGNKGQILNKTSVLYIYITKTCTC